MLAVKCQVQNVQRGGVRTLFENWPMRHCNCLRVPINTAIGFAGLKTLPSPSRSDLPRTRVQTSDLAVYPDARRAARPELVQEVCRVLATVMLSTVHCTYQHRYILAARNSWSSQLAEARCLGVQQLGE